MARKWWVFALLVVAGWGLAILWQSFGARDNPWDAVAKKQAIADPAAPNDGPSNPTSPGDPAKPVHYSDLIQERNRLYGTVWATEKLSEEYAEAFVGLWDALRAAEDRLAVLGKFPMGQLRLGRPNKASTALDWGIRRVTCDAEPFSQTPAAFQQFLAGLSAQGWRLVQSEWHHAGFEQPTGDQPARSTVEVVLHAANDKLQRLAIAKGTLKVEWERERSASGGFVPKLVDAVGIELLTRVGPAAFVPLKAEPNVLEPWPGGNKAEPVLVADLNRDGLPEIMLGGRGAAVQFAGQGTMQGKLIAKQPLPMSNAALVADLDGDGESDLVFVAPTGQPGGQASLVIFPGHDRGQFEKPPIVGWQGVCENPSVLTAGDIDRDGDLDVFVGQYKPPYTGGQMPTPYYDANDGFPAYLLLNDGQGKFTDGTAPAGLDKKRNRRTYAASFVDLNDDGHLDLIVTSDFAGVDIYRNDGSGKFTDATDALVSDRHQFGMSHTLADYDMDGKLDLFVVGTSSLAARRLDAMKLRRADRPEVDAMRTRMASGNRMWLASDGKLAAAAWSDQVARTGWAFGATSFDFDNDGDRDVYVANGNRSGRSARDYGTHFWTHDVYADAPKHDELTAKLFGHCLADMHRGEVSWNGYEHNALLMNLGGKGFVDVAFLLGVAFEFDSRAVVSDDFDGDGRMDLAVVENLVPRLGVVLQKLHVLANRLEVPAARRNWIGVRLVGAAGVSPLGASVTLRTPRGKQPARIVSGDSQNAQHAARVHFGLGTSPEVTAIEVRWPSGKVTKLDRPAAGKYHFVSPDDL